MKSIGSIREQIDLIDKKILGLLTARAKHVLQIGHHKESEGREFYIPYREKKILLRLAKLNKGPLPVESVEKIFEEILHSCRSLQKRLKVAYFGPEATFTHLAAMKKFGRYTDFIPARTVADVFSEVEKRHADYGFVPVENTTEGIVNHTFDMFMESDLKICSEFSMQIEQCLLSRNSSLKDIRIIYSHVQPLAQCRNWITANLPGAELIETTSTAIAAGKARERKGSAAISTELAAEFYGLNILARNIEDSVENYTRFLVIGPSFSLDKSGQDKTSIMLLIKDRVGALHDILTSFKNNRVNLTKIESRPTKKKAWEYVFFIDFLGHVKDRKVKKVLEEINSECLLLKILGSYPRAE